MDSTFQLFFSYDSIDIINRIVVVDCTEDKDVLKNIWEPLRDRLPFKVSMIAYLLFIK